MGMLRQISNPTGIIPMTNNNAQGDRLDRIEALVEANSRAIAEQRQSIERNTQNIERNTQNIAQLMEAVQAAMAMTQSTRESLQQTDQLTRRNAAAIARLEERMEQYIVEGREHREFIATQVEGIKVETRRILTHLFGENDNE